jgi:hypothetical protein
MESNMKPFLSETTKPARANHPKPEGVPVYRQEPGRANSGNEAGGFVKPSEFQNPTRKSE